MSTNLTFLFLAAFALTLAGRLWLTLRQIRFVAAHRGAVPDDFAERISLAAHQKAADYTVDRNKLAILTTLVDAALLMALTLAGGLAWLHDFWSARLVGLPYGLALIFSVMLISALIDLPFALYRQFVIEARYGFNRMSLGLFVGDLAKQTLLGIVIGAPVILAVLWLMGAMGSAWWFWVWLFWCAFNLLILFIYPTWIAPLFNKFAPLEEGEMKSRIEALLTRCDFTSSGLFVMDGSKRSSHGNAYFTGFGDNKRIVFFDTLLA
ncbi:MAG: M48 family metallopeptidase, partial [Candidatus Dechloromonas phosphoritropha]